MLGRWIERWVKKHRTQAIIVFVFGILLWGAFTGMVCWLLGMVWWWSVLIGVAVVVGIAIFLFLCVLVAAIQLIVRRDHLIF
jgi:hypothetical protein